MEPSRPAPSPVERLPQNPSRMGPRRRVLKRDASNFDDYLVIGLVVGVIATLLVLLVVL